MVGSAREKAIHAAVAEYEEALQRSGVARPWELVSQMGDALLEEVIAACADSFLLAVDDCVEKVASSELRVA